MRAVVPLRSVSTISGIWASIGRCIQLKRKRDPNTSKSCRCSGQYDRGSDRSAFDARPGLPRNPGCSDQAGPPASHTDANLLLLITCRAVNLSLERGNCDASCVAYVRLSKTAGARFGDYQTMYRFGQLGNDLVERHGLTHFQARTYMDFAYGVLPWTRHVRAARDLLRRAFEAANKIGDLTYAAYCGNQLNTNLLLAGTPLAEAEREAEQGLAFAQKAGFRFVIDRIATQLGLIRTLRGVTPTFGCFDDAHFDEHPGSSCGIQTIQTGIFRVPVLGPQAASVFLCRRLPGGNRCIVECTAAVVDRGATAGSSGISLLRRAVSSGLLRFRDGRRAPAVPGCHRYASPEAPVLGSELPGQFRQSCGVGRRRGCSAGGPRARRGTAYEQAIRSARSNGFVHNEALANELAARFYSARGFGKIAPCTYWTPATAICVGEPTGRCDSSTRCIPTSGRKPRHPAPTGTIGAPVEHLDLATVIRVSQAVSGEIVLDKLLDTLMRTAISKPVPSGVC